MSRIISALLLAVAVCANAAAESQEPVKLAKDAPMHHVVVKGDTLWDIAGTFLAEPWRWPEIWQINKDHIKDPHWIYPGDVIVLDLSGANPRLRLGKRVGQIEPQVGVEPIPREVPSIPVHLIEPFVSKPLVVDENGMKDAPQVIGVQTQRVMIGNDDQIFVLGIPEGSTVKQWHVYRPGLPVKDPETGKTLVHEAIYLGTAQVQELGEVSTLVMQTVKEEVLKGDLLVPAEKPELAPYMPHEADVNVFGRIASVYGGVNIGGKGSVVMINKGARDGIERGHVLSIYSKRSTVYKDHKTGKTMYKELPDQRYGILFIFRVFDKVAYGLVMESLNTLEVGDAVRNP